MTSFQLTSFSRKNSIAVCNSTQWFLFVCVDTKTILLEASHVVKTEINCQEITSTFFCYACFIDIKINWWFPNFLEY